MLFAWPRTALLISAIVCKPLAFYCVRIHAWSTRLGIAKAMQSDRKRTWHLDEIEKIFFHRQEEEGRWQYLGGRAPSAELGEAPWPKRAGKGGGQTCGSCTLQ